MTTKHTTHKPRLAFILIGLLFVFFAVSYIAVSVGNRPAIYLSQAFGHGGDQITAQYRGETVSLDESLARISSRLGDVTPVVTPPPTVDSHGCTIATQSWCAATSSCIAIGAPCSTTVTFDFVVRVDSGDGLTGLDACPLGYEWVGHIHGRVPSGVALESVSDPDYSTRTTSSGWMSLCVKSSDRQQKDITSVIVSNTCEPSKTQGTTCPSGYSPIGSVVRSSSQCQQNEPTLGSDESRGGFSVNGGTLMICQKGAPEHIIWPISSCGTMTRLGSFISTSDSSLGELLSFCEAAAGTTASRYSPGTDNYREPRCDEWSRQSSPAFRNLQIQYQCR